jgi:hypothetical protein
MGTKKDFTPRMAAMIDVAYIFADEVTNDRRVYPPHQVRGKNKSAIQRDHHIQPPALAIA